MNVLVTGATGFVGGHLVDRLLERGDQVTALVRSRTRARPLEQRGVILVEGDLANTPALAHAAGGQNIVYHVAAMLGARDEREMLRVNRDGTANVVRACERESPAARLVLVSSMAAGGPAERDAPKYTNDSDHPVTMYGRSKLAAEEAVRESALSWCILRAPVVYGPFDRDGMLPLFRAVNHHLAPMFGNGSMELSLIHVADLADALVLAGIEPSTTHGTFYVAYPEYFTSADLMRTIARVMNKQVMPIHIPRWATRTVLSVTGAWASATHLRTILHPDKIHEFYQDAWTADPELFITATGWTPQWDLERGLIDTVTWYRGERWL